MGRELENYVCCDCSAESFSEGFAGVTLDGQQGFVDRTGAVVIEPQYQVAMSFDRGLAAVWDIAVPPVSSNAGDGSNYINTSGEIVWKFEPRASDIRNDELVPSLLTEADFPDASDAGVEREIRTEFEYGNDLLFTRERDPDGELGAIGNAPANALTQWAGICDTYPSEKSLLEAKSAQVAMRQTAGLPMRYVVQPVTLHEDQAAASSAMDWLRQGIFGCSEWVVDEELSWRMTPGEFPEIGDDRFRIDLEPDSTLPSDLVGMSFVGVQRGRYVVFLGFQMADEDEMTATADKALERLR